MSAGLGAVADAYVLRARLFPATLAVLPLTLVALLVVPPGLLAKVLPFAFSAGVVFLLTQWVRDRGVKLQDRLLERWGGWPTTSMLRYTGSLDHEVVLQRRRRLLEEVTGITLPTAADEATDPAAEAVYHAATRALVSKVRARPGAERVQDENVAYGFRRNLLALKPFGLALTGIALAVDAFWLAPLAPIAALACAGAHLLIVLAWITVVTPDFVHRQARVYAQRLFETLEDTRLAPDAKSS